MLVLFDGWTSLFRDRVVPWRIAMAEKVRAQFEREVLPDFIAGRRWYGGKGTPVRRVTLSEYALWQRDARTWLVAIAQVEPERGEAQNYFVPLTLAWEDGGEESLRALAPLTVAKVRQQASVGVMADAFGDEWFCRALVEAIGARAEIKTTKGVLRCVPTAAFSALGGDAIADLKVTLPAALSSNTIVTLGERLFLKAYRRLQPGVNPEAEIGRFLTEVARFPNSVPVAGTIEHVDGAGQVTTLALLQGYVDHQGDAWQYTLDYLDRFFERGRSAPPAGAGFRSARRLSRAHSDPWRADG